MPIAEPSAALQTVVEACSSLGVIVNSPNRERRLLNYSQVGEALDYADTLDETLNLSVPTLFGFNVPRLVLQVLTAETNDCQGRGRFLNSVFIQQEPVTS